MSRRPAVRLMKTLGRPQVLLISPNKAAFRPIWPPQTLPYTFPWKSTLQCWTKASPRPINTSSIKRPVLQRLCLLMATWVCWQLNGSHLWSLLRIQPPQNSVLRMPERGELTKMRPSSASKKGSVEIQWGQLNDQDRGSRLEKSAQVTLRRALRMRRT